MEIYADNDGKKYFKVRKCFKNTIKLYLGFSFFIVFGLVFVTVAILPGVAVLVFGFSVMSILLLQNLKPGWAYYINQDGIRIKRTIKSRFFPREDIKALQILDNRAASRLLKSYQAKEVESVENSDVIGGFSSQIRLGKLIRYCSVPVVFTQEQKGNPLKISVDGVKTTGGFVLITFKDRSKHLLSPIDPESFTEAFEKSCPVYI